MEGKFSIKNITAKLSKIKEVLAEEETPETEEVQLEDVKMVDGTILRIEPAIEVGATVMVIGEDGELIDAPDAEHELESGAVIATEGGIIVEIQEVEGEEEVVEEEMSEEPVEQAEPTLEEKILEKVNELVTQHKEDLDAKVAGLKFAKEEEVTSLKEENKDLKNTLIEVVEMFEQFANAEAKPPKKSPSKAWMSKEDKKVDYSTLLRN